MLQIGNNRVELFTLMGITGKKSVQVPHHKDAGHVFIPTQCE
jgi:hypothetical protein